VNTFGNQYAMQQESTSEQTHLLQELDHKYSTKETKGAVWTNVALGADDQIRQRVSWALLQVLVVSASGTTRGDEGEPWFILFDIFVRHAFGNFRDVLREVSYNGLMAEYLTFLKNKCVAFAGAFPDENYAREVMQLFSIGLWRLNDDGTPLKDADGEQVMAYDNDDVATFARVWTGFDRQPTRSNLPLPSGRNTPNVFDPMMIKPSWRDRFPKAKLDAGYLGDRYPLCTDLPPQYFLLKGARYKYIGSNSAEGAVFDAWEGVNFIGRFEPVQSTSSLYKALCETNTTTGICTFPAEVVLGQMLACDGKECVADRLRSVKIHDPSSNKTVWYESIRPPCVRLTFAAGSVYTKAAHLKHYHQCSDPKAAVASAACCDDAGNPIDVHATSTDTAPCNFAAEMVTYATAQSRCAARGAVICETHWIKKWRQRFTKGCSTNSYSWLNKPCSVQVQVHSNGWINIVEPQPDGSTGLPEFALDSANVFRVRWENDQFPTHSSGCKSKGIATSVASECTPANRNTYLCTITVEDAAVFKNTAKIPSKEELEAVLFVGSFPPEDFNSTYTQCTSELCNQNLAKADVDTVRVYNRGGQSTLNLNLDTIFELPGRLAGSSKVYLRNRVSTVRVGSFSFRNPPTFMPLLGERFNQITWWGESVALLDANYEVEALLDHLFEHDNTAPFIAHRLIQRLVTSNPSPRYVKAVVAAFRTGVYAPAGRTFSGRYGDLGATVAAVLLDREARSTTLDADPTHGKLREPLLKVVHVLRAMEYTPHAGREVVLKQMELTIGMAPFMSQSVFNFYLPEYQPPGPLARAALVSPEAQLSTMPFLIGYLNGLSSLVDYGLTSCENGFGDTIQQPSRQCGYWRRKRGDTRQNADGVLAFVPQAASADKIVDELDLLLTTGRLSNNSKSVISAAYNDTLATGGSSSDALKKAQKLMFAAPEFHATNNNLNVATDRPRDAASSQTSLGRPFKAIVVISMTGGADSYNLLVPHSGCKEKDMFDEYTKTRTNIALSKSELLQIDAQQNQPCSKFGLHPSLKFVQEIYQAGRAAWVANVGSLVEPTTPQQYKDKSVRLPPSLFAHNIQQRAMYSVHAQRASAKGVLGRAMAALMDTSNTIAPYSSQLFSLMGNVKMLEGATAPTIISATRGIQRYIDLAALSAALANITLPVSTSLFAESFSQFLESSLHSSEAVGALLSDTVLDTDAEFQAQHESSKTAGVSAGGLSLQFAQVAKILKLQSELRMERAAFVTKIGSFDTHSDDGGTLRNLMTDVDKSLEIFVKELKAQGLYENVTIVTVSDFGRTLSSNGIGTDHAWGGNHFVMGGSINGGKILGKFPPSLELESEFAVSKRGAVLPTTSWEGMWKGLVQWFGVEEQHMATVLPNLANFPKEEHISQEEMFNL